MFAYCLADLFNLRLWRTSFEPSYSDIRDGLVELTLACFNAFNANGLAVSDLTIRLYGGWHGEQPGDPNAIRDLLQAVLRDFPGRIGGRVRVQIADSPIWDRSLRLLRTLRKARLQPAGGDFNSPLSCYYGGGASCTIPLFESWWKGRCPEANCRVKLREIGVAKRQKMVDTLLTADALTIARDELAEVIVLASDDSDMYPALFASAESRAHVIALRRGTEHDTYYEGLFAIRGIHTYDW